MLKNLWPEFVFPYDLTLFKSFENFHGLEMKRRFRAVALIFVVSLFLPTDRLTITCWAVVYLGSLWLYISWVQTLPDELNRKQFFHLVMGRSPQLAIYLFLPLHAWSQPDVMYKICGFVGVFGPMMNAVSSRGRDPLLRITDLWSVACAYVYMAMHTFLLVQDPAEALFFGCVLLIVFMYFFQAVEETVQTRIDLEAAQKSQIEQERLRSLGQLTGGVAHDFNNLLTVIIGNLNLIDEIAKKPDAETQELMQEIESAAMRAANLTSQLLVFSRKSELEVEEVALAEKLAASEMLITRLLPATHRLSMELNTNCQTAVDYKRLENVLVNLVINARDAMPNGGTIRITLDLAASPERMSTGTAIRLSVVDIGVGIPDEIKDRVLEPFFTTKPVGKGSGLGLSMALGFAEQSGGTLTLTSRQNKGTRVSIWLPPLA